MADSRPHVLATIACAALVGCCVLPTTASAAVLTGNPVASPTIPANLTSLGDTAWGYWNSSSGTGVPSQAPTNIKSGSSGIISSATAIGGAGNVRGSSTPTAVTFAFSDGTSPVSGSATVPGVFNATLNSVGSGVAVSLTLPDTQLYKVSIWVSGYNVIGTFGASLDGQTYTDSTFSYAASKVARLYELNAQANNAGDVMSLSYRVGTVNSASSAHALIAGIALDVVPEPAALGLLAPMAMLALRRRRSA